MSKDYRNLYEYCEEEKGKEYYDMNDSVNDFALNPFRIFENSFSFLLNSSCRCAF